MYNYYIVGRWNREVHDDEDDADVEVDFMGMWRLYC